MGLATALGLGTAIVGGIASNRAARAQERAAERQAGQAEQQYAQTRADFEPFRQFGTSAINPLQGLLYGGNQTEALRQTPGYQFAFDEAMRSVNAGAAGNALFGSGARAMALQDRAAGLASQTLGQERNALFQALNIGTGSAANLANAGQASTNAINAALGQQGQAQAAGIGGVANAIGQGLGALSTLQMPKSFSKTPAKI